MTELITISQIRSYKALSVNVNQEKKITPAILEAQQFDLKKLMGDAFYLEFVNDFNQSPSLPIYSDLYNGSEFTHCGKTIRHEGIKTVLAYLTYARYVLNSNVESTAFGTVRKKTEDSEQVDEKTITRLHNQAYAGAMEYWEDVVKFLDVQNYTLWNECRDKKVFKGRIGGVSSEDFEARKHYKKYRRWQ